MADTRKICQVCYDKLRNNMTITVGLFIFKFSSDNYYLILLSVLYEIFAYVKIKTNLMTLGNFYSRMSI